MGELVEWKRFEHRGMSIEAAADSIEDSVFTLRAPDDLETWISLAARPLPPEATLATLVAQQLTRMGKDVVGLTLEERREATVGLHHAIRLHISWDEPDDVMHQLQLHVCTSTTHYFLTGTTTEPKLRRLTPAFELVAASLKLPR